MMAQDLIVQQAQVLVQSPVVQVMLVLGQLYTLLMYQK